MLFRVFVRHLFAYGGLVMTSDYREKRKANCEKGLCSLHGSCYDKFPISFFRSKEIFKIALTWL